MCKTKPDSISVDENVNLLAAKEITDRYNVIIGGNIPLTSIMLLGNQQDNMKFAVDLLDSVKIKRTSFLLPAAICRMMCRLKMVLAWRRRHWKQMQYEMVKNYQSAEVDTSNVILPDYAHLKNLSCRGIHTLIPHSVLFAVI